MARIACLLLVAISMLCSVESRAETDLTAVFEIPLTVRSQLRSGVFLEQFIQQTLQPLRSADRDRDGLDLGDADRLARQAAAEMRAAKVSGLLRNDLDGDGRVTEEEVRQRSAIRQGTSSQNIADQVMLRQVDAVMKADRDGDRIITLDEMLASAPLADAAGAKFARADAVVALIDADPNGDGKMTGEELEQLARSWFAIVDTNGDRYIDEAESTAFRAVAAPLKPLGQLSQCKLPQAAPAEAAFAIGIYRGAAVSSVAVAGQDQKTSAVRVNVGEGGGSVYLLLTSVESVVWQIEGAADRVTRVVVISGQRTAGNQVAAGVTGVAADRVTFPNCQLRLHEMKPTETPRVRAYLADAIGRTLEAIVATNSAEAFDLPAGTFVEGSQSQRAPAGFDPDMWLTTLRFYPAGLATIDAQRVISPGPAETYAILPQKAGLAQLLGNGSLVRQNGALSISKPIERYPAGLNGGHSVRFILRTGVAPPGGKPGHSCVISEETGKAVDGGISCR